jgi:hypothetical protein
MIGRRKHPGEAERYVFVPLRRGEGIRWVPVPGQGHRESLWEAAEVCAGDHAARMAEIARKARVIRAIVEHPELEFSFESVDADMLRDEIRDLEALIRVENENADRLLDPPDSEHVIYDSGMRLCAAEGGVLEPREPEDSLSELADDEPWQSADELFAHLLEAILRATEELAGETVSRAGIADAIVRLRDVHGDDDGTGGIA